MNNNAARVLPCALVVILLGLSGRVVAATTAPDSIGVANRLALAARYTAAVA